MSIFAAGILFALVWTLVILGQDLSFLLFTVVLAGPVLLLGISSFAVIRHGKHGIGYRVVVVFVFLILCGSYGSSLLSWISDMSSFAYDLIIYGIALIFLQSLFLVTGAKRALVELFRN